MSHNRSISTFWKRKLIYEKNAGVQLKDRLDECPLLWTLKYVWVL